MRWLAQALFRALVRWHLRRARAHAEALIGLPWDGEDSYRLDEVIDLEDELGS